MATSKRNASLRILNDGVVDLGEEKFLPKGDYPGWIETLHIPFRGQKVDQIGRVMLSLTEAQIAATLGVPVDPHRLGVDFDVYSHYSKGEVIEV
jgi:hypothetical protein